MWNWLPGWTKSSTRQLATSGNRWEGIAWCTLGALPWRDDQIPIQARAVLASREACLATTLRSERRTLAQERTCVQVYPAPGSAHRRRECPRSDPDRRKAARTR